MSAVARRVASRIEGPTLDWGMAVLGLVFVGGLFLDGWAHTHGKVDQSFFTPWHAVLYSGFFLNFCALAGVALLNRSRGSTWPNALPGGYWLSLLGMALWFIGGPGDLLWHTIFGIEQNIDALYSPTHLILATGLVLAASGPYRAMWARRETLKGLAAQLPMLLSLAATLSTLSFFVQFTHPISNGWGLGNKFMPDIYQAMGVASWILFAAILMGALLLTLRRWPPAFGAFTLILALNGFSMGFIADNYPTRGLILFIVVGLIFDVLYQTLKPSSSRIIALRLFAFLAPVILTSLYFVLGSFTLGIGWTVHLVGGVIFLTGIVGLFMSVLVFPPAIPEA